MGAQRTEVAALQPQVSCSGARRTMVLIELPTDLLPPFPTSPTPSRGNSELPLSPKAAAFGKGRERIKRKQPISGLTALQGWICSPVKNKIWLQWR